MGLMEVLQELQTLESQRHMGGAGTTAGSAGALASAGASDPSLSGGGSTDPIYSGLLNQVMQQSGQTGGGGGGGGVGAVDGTGPLRTINGVTMVAPAIRSLIQAKKALGLPIFGNVVSSYRTRAEQQALYNAYLNGTGNLAAKPGTSNHESGNAVDISSSFLSANPELRRWLLGRGWLNNVSGEPWHWSYGT